MARPIVFLSDYGLADEFVGVCHGVIARIAPEARVIDVTHGIPAMNVAHGGAVLASAVRYMPADAVYLAIVDPGVGSARRAIAVKAESGAILACIVLIEHSPPSRSLCRRCFRLASAENDAYIM